MITRLFCVALAFSISFALVAEEEKPAKPPARSITLPTPPQGFPKTKATQPMVIKSKEDVSKHFASKATQEALLKEVDFAKEQIIYFAWAGSGQDQITVDAAKSKEGEVVFRYQPGRTRDLRPHHRLFAMPAQDSWKVAQGRD